MTIHIIPPIARIAAASAMALAAVTGASMLSLDSEHAVAQPIEEEDEDTGLHDGFPVGKMLLAPRNKGRIILRHEQPRSRDHRRERPPGGMVTGAREPGVAYATSSKKCGDTVYEVSTGNDDGYCDPQGEAIHCRDGEGNSARVSCKEGCGTTSGSGYCKVKQ